MVTFFSIQKRVLKGIFAWMRFNSSSKIMSDDGRVCAHLYECADEQKNEHK